LLDPARQEPILADLRERGEEWTTSPLHRCKRRTPCLAARLAAEEPR